MHTTAHQEPLDVLHHLALALPSAPAAAFPATARVTRFGQDGRTVRSTSVTSYAGLKHGARGQMTGTITSETRTDAGALLETSAMALLPDGTVGRLHAVVQNRFAPGPFKVVDADLSALAWTPAGSIQAGTVAITTRDAATQAVRTEGRLVFAGERLCSASFAHRAWAGDGLVHGYTEVDYSDAELVGMRLVGGACALTARDAALRLTSRSRATIAADGTVSRVTTETFEPLTGKLLARVAADYSGLRFDTGGHIAAGTAGVVSTGAAGVNASRTTSSFANGVPSQTVTETFVHGAPRLRIVTDYAAAHFDNDLRVVTGDVVTTTSDPSGAVLSVATTTYGKPGSITSRRIERRTRTTGAVRSVTLADYAGAVFDTHGDAAGGVLVLTTTGTGGTRTVTRRELPERGGTAQPLAAAFKRVAMKPPAAQYGLHSSEVTDAEGGLQSRTERVTRADGSLLAETVTTFANQRPIRSAVTHFAPDGKAIVATSVADLSAFAYAPQTGRASGTIGVATRFRGVTPSANTTLTFGADV